MAVRVVPAPTAGMWRIGRAPDPLAVHAPAAPSELRSKANSGNRFDSPLGSYRTLYFATSLEGCFGETLARFRPDPRMRGAIGDEWHERGFMDVGDVPADWRLRRLATRVRMPAAARFLDIEAIETRQALRPLFAPTLALFGHQDLDVALVRGGDRRITRSISWWAHEQWEEAVPRFAGVRYLSRLNSGWECWAVFDRVPIAQLEVRPITRDDRDFQAVSRLYDLRPY